jgi:hypothetical protein
MPAQTGVRKISELSSTDRNAMIALLETATGVDRLSADAIQSGSSNYILSAEEYGTISGIYNGDFSDVFEYVRHEQTIANLGATSQTSFALPSGDRVISFALNVESAITYSGGGTTFTTTIDDGSPVKTISTGTTGAKNDKITTCLDTLLDAESEIKLTPNSGSFNSGSVKILLVTVRAKALPNA